MSKIGSNTPKSRAIARSARQAKKGQQDNSKLVQARWQQEQRQAAAASRDDEEEDDEDEEDYPQPAKSRAPTLDLIARSTSHSAHKASAAAILQQAAARTPKNTPRPKPVKRKRDADSDEEGADAAALAPTKHTSTVASFVPESAPSAAAAASSASSDAPALPFAPAATSAGALFSSLSPALDPDIVAVLAKSFGFTRMTPVQAQCIPVMLRKDVAVQSYTGSGKTLSFVLPMLQMLLTKFTTPDGVLAIEPHAVAAIILSPTRELATQICGVIAPFVAGGEHAGPRLGKFKLAQFIGGSAMSTVEADFAKHGGNIVVATPGRLNSTLGKLACFQVKELRILILDEADRLLDEGFEQDISDILRKLPKQRRTGLFSATQTRAVKELRRAGLQDKFAKIDVLLEWKRKAGADAAAESSGRTQMTPTTLHNFYTLVRSENKLSLLVDFLVSHANDKIIVFFLTGDQVDYFSRVLPRLRALTNRNMHKNVFALRGGKQGMDQNKRTAQFQAFLESDSGILVATDVAARGIDVPNVDWIIQYDPPKDAAVFVHRIGRTARMGKQGSAIVYLTPEERAYIDLVQNLNVPMELKPVPDDVFEAHHSWKADPDAAELVRAMEEGKNAQGFEAVKKKQAARHQAEKKSESKEDSASKHPLIRSVLQEVKYLCLEDRFLMEKAQRAFTSFIDGYKQHVMTHALNYTKLPFGDVALGMGLLYLPKMPDMKHLTASVRYDRAPVKAMFIKFKDTKLQSEHDKKEALIHEKNQQEQVDREAKWKARQKKLDAAGPKRKKRAHEVIRDEWEELQNENRLLKKLKQGKITKKEFEIAVGERKKSKKSKSDAGDDGSDDSDAGSEAGDSDASDDEDARPAKKAKHGAVASAKRGASAAVEQASASEASEEEGMSDA